MHQKDRKVKQVIAYLLQRNLEEDHDEPLTQLKLQKLLYYAQGLHLALRGKPLFDDKIHAWQHGPVCTSIYRDLPKGGNPIALYEDNDELVARLTEDEQEVLAFCFMVYGRYSAWKLRHMSHQKGGPWMNARESSAPLSTEEIKSFFKVEIEDSDNFALRHSANNEEYEDISDLLDCLKAKNDPVFFSYEEVFGE